MRVLFLTASFGTGHTRAARAVQHALLDREPDATTLLVDPLAAARPMLSRVVSQTYLNVLKVTPWAFRYLYTGAEHPRLARVGRTEVGRLLFLAMSQQVDALVQQINPDAVVCTHPFPLSVAGSLRARGKLGQAVLGVIITDFHAHPFYVTPGTDFYAVGAAGLLPDLLAAGATAEEAVVTGIPIDPGFGQPVNRPQVLTRLGLREDLLTVLVMGGGLGLGPVMDAVEAVELVGSGVQVIAVAGRNRRLRRELQRHRPPAGFPLVTLGYTRRVPELMGAADLLVSKPGGLTSAEALASRLPMCCVAPLPGQEERNLDFLRREGVLVSAAEARDLTLEIKRLRDQRSRLEAMRRAAAGLACPDAAHAVADLILSRVADRRRIRPA